MKVNYNPKLFRHRESVIDVSPENVKSCGQFIQLRDDNTFYVKCNCCGMYINIDNLNAEPDLKSNEKGVIKQ